MNTIATQAQQFAAKQAENAAADMLSVIEVINKRAKLIARIALGVSMPHQIGYLIGLCIPSMHMSVTGIFEAVGMIMIAVAVPIVADLLILTSIDTISSPIIERASKVRAVKVLLFAAAVSGTINFLAPAPPVIKGLAAFLVISIALAVALKFVRADWKKHEAELAPAAAVAEVAVDQEAVDRRRAAALRGAETRRQRKADKDAKDEEKREARRLAAARRRLEKVAPSSPGHPAVILSANDKQVLADHDFPAAR